MRSPNYSSNPLTFIRLKHHQMVRVALINGLSDKNAFSREYHKIVNSLLEPSDRVRGFQPLKDTRACGSILSTTQRTKKQDDYLKGLLTRLGFLSELWKDMPYDILEQYNIIQDVDNLDDLVEKAMTLTPFGVLKVPEDIFPEGDWLKHIPLANKLSLTSKPNLTAFAYKHGIELPEAFIENGYVSNELWDTIESYGYTLRTALSNAIGELRIKPDNLISTVSFKNRSRKEETRLKLHDVIEALERFVHRHMNGEEIIFRLEEGKYSGTDSARVPKRLPIKRTKDPIQAEYFNLVEVHYMPDFFESGDQAGWLHTLPHCSCPYSVNLRNFEEKNQDSRKVVWNWDPHSMDMVLEVLYREDGTNAWRLPKNPVPIVTPKFIQFSDVLRYNTYVETKGGRRPLHETEIEITLFEYAKKYVFNAMFCKPNEIPNDIIDMDYVLDPMYFTADKLDML